MKDVIISQLMIDFIYTVLLSTRNFDQKGYQTEGRQSTTYKKMVIIMNSFNNTTLLLQLTGTTFSSSDI